ncbi:hypothetical protein ABEF95_006733 [Exophiala dermatitidis]
MWLAKGHPPVVDSASALSMIKEHQSQDAARDETVVLLATPQMAHFLDLDGFLRSAMEAIYGSLRTKTASGNLKKVKSVTAVVDALPEPFSTADKATNPGPVLSEGLALLLSSAAHSDKSTYRATDDEVNPATLSFSSSEAHGDGAPGQLTGLVRHISLPVANTIFVNGTRATLFEDSWDIMTCDSESAVVAHRDRRPLQNFRIDMGCGADEFLNGSIPLRSLTRPRKVVRSMGNVLAQIEVDGKPVPASRELEEAVTRYTKTLPTHATRGPVQVFALVRPPRTASIHDEGQEDSTTLDYEHKQASSRILSGLWQDAKLFKVTGGGGGWGKRQGLLSLDTAVDFAANEATVGFPDFDLAEDLSREVGSHGMIPQGGTVEFLLNSVDEAPSSLSASSGTQGQSAVQEMDDSATSFILGTVANPDMQDYWEDVTSSTDSGVSFYPNHFGMISYGGAALGSDELLGSNGTVDSPRERSRNSSRTRLDVPNSFFILQAGQILAKK